MYSGEKLIDPLRLNKSNISKFSEDRQDRQKTSGETRKMRSLA